MKRKKNKQKEGVDYPLKGHIKIYLKYLTTINK